MDLIEIFKVGTHTDSKGQTREWTEKDLQEIASLYDPANHEAPIVIGHPDIDSPAYGWVESLKVEGGKLLAKVKDVADEFKDWVSKGLYKKVSIALYPDLGLRHIGFLGATPPAVKGLRQATFSEKAAWIIVEDIKLADQSTEKQDQDARSKKYNIAVKDGDHVTKPGEWSNVPDDEFLDPVNYRYPCPDADQTRVAAAYWGKPDNQSQYSSEEKALITKRLAEKEKKFKIGEHADVTQGFSPDDSNKPRPLLRGKGGIHMDLGKFFSDLKALVIGAEKELVPDDPNRKFTEADISAKVKEAKDLAFAESQKKVEVEVKAKEEAEKKLREIETKVRNEGITAFCETLCKEGKLTPALRKIIEPVMIAVSEIPDVIEFSEGVKKSRLDGIKDFLTEIPKVVTFKEVAGGDGPNSGGSAAEKLSALTKQKMEVKKDLSYGAAFSEVQKENPELAKELLAEIRPQKNA
jgi:hypothetical protein